jgi:predicted MFS family arabinose efflux permease
MEAAATTTAWPGRRPRPLLIWAITLSGITANTLIAPVLPDIIEDFRRPDSAAGLVVAAASLPGVVAAPVIGVLADRLGRRRVVVPCLVIFGFASALAVAAPGYWVLVLARLLMGFGSAGLINLAVVLIGDHWSGQERVRQVGRNAAVLTAGLAVLPPLAGLLGMLGTWRLSQAPSVLALLTAWAAWAELDDLRPPHAESTLGGQLRDAATTLRSPTMAATILSGFLIFVMIFGLFLTVLPVHLQRDFGLDAGARGLLLAVPALSATVVSLNLARLRERLGLRTLLVSGAALFGVALALTGWASSVVGVLGGLLLYGTAEGFTVPSLQEITAARAPAAQRGTVLAVWVAAVRLGQASGPLVFAAVFAAVGTGEALVIGALVSVPVIALHAFTGIGAPPPQGLDGE